MNPVVLISSRLDGAQLALARQVCADIGVNHENWPPEPPPFRYEKAALLYIAAQPAGQRRISGETTRTVTSYFPRLPLVLLCQERLTREAVLLDGETILIDPSVQASKLAGYLRQLLPPAPVMPGEPLTGQYRASWQGERWWAGVYAQRPANTAVRLGGRTFPYVCPGTDLTTFAAVVPASCKDTRDSADLAVLAQSPPADIASAVALRLEKERCTVVCSAETRAWLYSPTRVPNDWTFQTRLRSFEVVSGDLFVLQSDLTNSKWPTGLLQHPEVRTALSRGAATVLQTVERLCERYEESLAIVALEVR